MVSANLVYSITYAREKRLAISNIVRGLAPKGVRSSSSLPKGSLGEKYWHVWRHDFAKEKFSEK